MLLKSIEQPFVSDWEMYLSSWIFFAVAATKSLQSCPTLCDPRDGSPPGFPVPGILQARTLEWAAISFPNVWKWKVKVKSLSCFWLLATPWIAAYQAPLSMDFPGKSTGVWCNCLLRPNFKSWRLGLFSSASFCFYLITTYRLCDAV